MSAPALEMIHWAIAQEETSLDLAGLGLTSLPAEIGKLTAVRQLSLRHNQLTSLPPEIGNLHHLQQLSLANNLLTSLPPELGQLTQLTHLNLRHNQLTQLPIELLRLTELQMLQLQDNPLPLPADIMAKWNQPQVILAYYRTYCLVLPEGKDAPPDRNSLLWLLTEWMDEAALAALCAELVVPVEVWPGEGEHGRVAQAEALINFHAQHNLLPDFTELLRIIKQTSR
jgi:Leucine-rich repeat (LRR) protein